MRSIEGEAGLGVIEGDPRPAFDAMTGRAGSESRRLPLMRILVTGGAWTGRQAELDDVVRAQMTSVTRHGQVRPCQRKLRALMLVDAELWWDEPFDRVAVRTLVIQLTAVHILMAAGARVESGELQRTSLLAMT